MAYTNRLTIPGYRCPSTILPEFYANSNNVGAIQMFSCYTGISGSNIAGVTDGAANGGSYGPVSGTGALYANSKMNLAGLTDGTSNVMMVGEQSNHLRDTNRAIVAGGQGAITSQGPYGWTMGAGNTAIGNQYNERAFNCTTVTYTINQFGFSNSGGTGEDTGNNIPLSSLHPGGCVALLGDASTRFLSQTTPLITLGQLCTGNDGAVVQID